MNISKDGKTLYFSDDEIENSTNGEKKVYVTKRINGKESHSKIENNKNNLFDFNNEIVIGVTPKNNTIEAQNRSKNTGKINKKQQKKLDQRITNKHGKNQQIQSKKNIQERKKTNQKNRLVSNDIKNTDRNTINNQKKRLKKKKSSKKIIGIFSSLLLIGAIVILALTAPIFNIEKIDVNGNNQVTTDTIISISGLKKGENIFKFNNSIIDNIKENQYIQEVKIKRKLPGTIQITITERAIKYQIKLVNSYAYIDKNGYILEISSIKKEVPIIVGFNITENELLNKKRLDTKDLEKLNDILKISDSSKAIEIENIITEINIEKENDYYIYIESQNKKIFIGDVSNLTNKMLYVKKILEEEKDQSGTGYVNGDIGSGFKPYFRPE